MTLTEAMDAADWPPFLAGRFTTPILANGRPTAEFC